MIFMQSLMKISVRLPVMQFVYFTFWRLVIFSAQLDLHFTKLRARFVEVTFIKQCFGHVSCHSIVLKLKNYAISLKHASCFLRNKEFWFLDFYSFLSSRFRLREFPFIHSLIHEFNDFKANVKRRIEKQLNNNIEFHENAQAKKCRGKNEAIKKS